MELVFVFLIAAVGYLVGSVKIRGIELGTAAVLLVALVFGHFGAEVPAFINGLGIALFVTSVGFIAGPKFFRNLKKNATSYVLLGAIVIVTGAAACVALIVWGGLPSALATGLFAGALTSTPALAAAVEAVGETKAQLVTVGYGVAYPFGVIGVVLFVQLVPKFLKTDMVKERKRFEAANTVEIRPYEKKLFSCDPMGMMPFAAAVVLGVLLGRVSIPLPGGAQFALGISGGPLISGLVFGHFQHIGRFNLSVKPQTLEVFREFGLVLFLIAAGVTGGKGFLAVLAVHGPLLFVYGAVITLLPLWVGYLFAHRVLRLNLFNSLGSICGGMTSTPALGSLISVTGTAEIATAYAAAYPVALVLVVLASQFMAILL